MQGVDESHFERVQQELRVKRECWESKRSKIEVIGDVVQEREVEGLTLSRLKEDGGQWKWGEEESRKQEAKQTSDTSPSRSNSQLPFRVEAVFHTKSRPLGASSESERGSHVVEGREGSDVDSHVNLVCTTHRRKPLRQAFPRRACCMTARKEHGNVPMFIAPAWQAHDRDGRRRRAGVTMPFQM